MIREHADDTSINSIVQQEGRRLFPSKQSKKMVGYCSVASTSEYDLLLLLLFFYPFWPSDV